ncbi:Uncharacterised protein [Mycobacterium tuberculosis]|nr:Uncharacterised protein [Mycobacterium tuberculosis]
MIVFQGQRIVVDDGGEKRLHVGGTRGLVAVLVGYTGRNGHERDVPGRHMLQRSTEFDQVFGLDVVHVAVTDEHVDDVVEPAEVEQGVRRDHRTQQRRQKQLLAFDAPVVAIALGGDLASAHIVQRGRPVNDLASGVLQHRAQFVVPQRGGAAYLDAAEGLDHPRETDEVNRDEPVDAQARQFLNDLH